MPSINASADRVRELAAPAISRVGNRIACGALLLVCAVALFVNLGAPALFEPDEGRNAEKAREILLLGDWITPHENFAVVLDKPIFYYWLVAASYKALGVSEGSARLPSALAAAGSVALVFFFAQRFFGYWEALWSALVLVTSLEFFLLARIVIFDMTLSFFITLALFSFFAALRQEGRWRRRSLLALMYVSLGAATLVKGPIGVVLPGMVGFAYLLIERKLSWLAKLELPYGMPLFLAVVTPWYYEVERANPGYLRYFLWEENFVRYFTPHFHRTQGWYYFILVIALGFLPWSPCMPLALRDGWRGRRDERWLFLFLWAVLPFIFFSFSSAKLPHYILPIFPPLALLAGASLQRQLRAPGARPAWPLALSCFFLSALPLCFLLAASFPELFPGAAQAAVADFPPGLAALAASAAIASIGLGLCIWSGRCKTPTALFVGLSCALVLYLGLLGQAATRASIARSTREFVAKASPYMEPNAQWAIYDTSLETLPFYLQIERPMWIVWSGEKSSVLGSFYLAEHGARPAPGFGPMLLTLEEFNRRWAHAPENHFRVVIKAKNLPRLERESGHFAKTLLEDRGLLLVTN